MLGVTGGGGGGGAADAIFLPGTICHSFDQATANELTDAQGRQMRTHPFVRP